MSDISNISDLNIIFISTACVTVVAAIALYCRWVGQRDFLDINVNPDYHHGLPTVTAPFL